MIKNFNIISTSSTPTISNILNSPSSAEITRKRDIGSLRKKLNLAQQANDDLEARLLEKKINEENFLKDIERYVQ